MQKLNTEVAAQSLGQSSDPIYVRVKEILECKGLAGIYPVCDVGCGKGLLGEFLRPLFKKFIGLDLLRYDNLSNIYDFKQADLNQFPYPLGNDHCILILAIEVIEHLENPRALVRELTRISKVGGFILISTPNQLSLLSKLTLLIKNQFNAFQANDYPAHISALLPEDLKRISKECSLKVEGMYYSNSGRIPFSRFKYPKTLSRIFPQLLSDNVFILLQKPLQK